MKNYTYRNIMFYLCDNNIDKFQCDLENYFNSKNIIVYFEKNKYINVEIIRGDLSVYVNFEYTDKYFKNCYELNGSYLANKYKGSRKVISELFELIMKKYLIVTKKEPLYCHWCKELIGYTFNDFNDLYNSVTPLIDNDDDENDKNLIYDPSYEISQCEECKNYLCEACSVNHMSDNFCDDCLGDEYENYEYCDENLKSHNSCTKRTKCCDCENYEECCEIIDDARIGYEMFCDSIVGCGYDSMEDFWECNGI